MKNSLQNRIFNYLATIGWLFGSIAMVVLAIAELLDSNIEHSLLHSFMSAVMLSTAIRLIYYFFKEETKIENENKKHINNSN